MSDEKKVYTLSNLPPFKPETENGYMLPKTDFPVAVCVAPADAKIKRPPSWGAGQALEIESGTHHIAVDSLGDSYPNKEFDMFYEVTKLLDARVDPRAAFLVGFWCGQGEGYDIEVSEAVKTKPAIVLGEVATEAVGSIYHNHEGESELVEGSRILQSPDDPNVTWTITPKVYFKKYQDEGKIHFGPLPATK